MNHFISVVSLMLVFGSQVVVAETYHPMSRITDKGGTVDFVFDEGEKMKIQVTDSYGTRLIGDKSGYTKQELEDLMRSAMSRRSDVFCPIVKGSDFLFNFPMTGWVPGAEAVGEFRATIQFS